MSTAQLVVQYLPYLRRYARALTGSQPAGDAYVAATLEALVSEPETIDREGDIKADLFRVFTRIWNSLSVNGRAEGVTRDLPAEARLGQITPLPRQAFLLSSLEGFSEEESARILAVGVDEVRTLVEEAGRELAADIVTDIMIIASGRSNRHVGAIADHVLRKLKDEGHSGTRVEGLKTCDWVLIDAGDVVLHIFRPEVREFYDLEKMWSVSPDPVS